MSRKILCDRCGKDITGLQQIGFVGMSFRDPESGELLQENPLQDMDFCPECMDAIRAFVSEMPKLEPKPEPVVTLEEVAELAAKLEPDEKKKQPEPKKNPKPPGSKNVDTGKLLALRRAGWTMQEIADEMKISSATVSYHLSRMKEKL